VHANPQPGFAWVLEPGSESILQLGFGRTSSTTREQSTPPTMPRVQGRNQHLKARHDRGPLDKNVGVAAGDGGGGGPRLLAGGKPIGDAVRIRNRIEAGKPYERCSEQEAGVIGGRRVAARPQTAQRRSSKPTQLRPRWTDNTTPGA